MSTELLNPHALYEFRMTCSSLFPDLLNMGTRFNTQLARVTVRTTNGNTESAVTYGKAL